MEDTTIENERIYQGALNEDRNEIEEKPEAMQAEESSRPDFVTYMFLEGFIGLPGDLLKLIPLVGTILSLPFSAAMWLWRASSSRFKNSPAQKILINGLTSWIPLSNTVFLTSCYIEETKLGKAILGKVSKSLKTTGK